MRVEQFDGGDHRYEPDVSCRRDARRLLGEVTANLRRSKRPAPH
jgi:hypothetical protein